MTLPAMLACLLLQNTWVVDDNGGPGVNFTDIPPAIAAAADGDILLVQPGLYSHFTLSGKGLRILGTSTGNTVVILTSTSPTTVVSGIPASSLVYIDRLRFVAATPSPVAPSPPRLEVLGPATRVVLADVVVLGAPGETALRVDGAEFWAFRCFMWGGASAAALPGGHGFHARNGSVAHLSACDIRGGSGAPFCFLGPLASDAGQGTFAESASAVWIAGSTVVGGNQACCAFFSVETCGIAGAGIYANSSVVRVSGDSSSIVRGGDAGCVFGLVSFSGAGIASAGGTVTHHGGSVFGGQCPSGCVCLPGPPFFGPGITPNAAPLPGLEGAGDLTLAGGSATLTLANGPPGALFFVGVTGIPAHDDPGPGFLGEFLVDPSAVFPFFAGTLSPTGDASRTVPVSGLPANFANFPFYFQAIVLDPSGTFWRLSNSTVATIRP